MILVTFIYKNVAPIFCPKMKQSIGDEVSSREQTIKHFMKQRGEHFFDFIFFNISLVLSDHDFSDNPKYNLGRYIMERSVYNPRPNDPTSTKNYII